MKNKMTTVEALKILENAQGKNFYTTEYQDAIGVAIDIMKEKINPTAHWIFSGDEDDYDGYYINCSHCGAQRKAYDRNGELDLPCMCPNCNVLMNNTEV